MPNPHADARCLGICVEKCTFCVFFIEQDARKWYHNLDVANCDIKIGGEMAKNEIAIITEDDIRGKIYLIRGYKVMMDADLAAIYGYETRYLNQQAGRNAARFEGEEFRFRLTVEEYENLKLQNATSSWGGTRKPPFAYTEQGIYMLMAVLNGEMAIRQSRALMKLFKKMKIGRAHV